MTGSSDRYVEWNGSVKQGSLGNIASFRHYQWHFTKIMSYGIYKQ